MSTSELQCVRNEAQGLSTGAQLHVCTNTARRRAAAAVKHAGHATDSVPSNAEGARGGSIAAAAIANRQGCACYRPPAEKAEYLGTATHIQAMSAMIPLNFWFPGDWDFHL